MLERWADTDVPNYRISDHGVVEGPRGIVNPRVLHGYLTVNIGGWDSKTRAIHRLIANAFIPNPDDLPRVHFIDKNKMNVHYTNLRWGLRVEYPHPCRECNIPKEEEEFPPLKRHKVLKTGESKTYASRKHICKDCRKKHYRDEYILKKKRAFQKILHHEVPYQLKNTA